MEEEFEDLNAELEEHYLDDVYGDQPGENKIRTGDDRIGSPYLNRLTKAKLVAVRASQLSKGAPYLIDRNLITSFAYEEIAKAELAQAIKGRIEYPIAVVRKFPDGTSELWKVSDFKYYIRD